MHMHGARVACVISNRPQVYDEKAKRVLHDGYVSTVIRGNQKRGPFETIHEAHLCAKAWNGERAEFDKRIVTMGLLKKKIETAFQTK